MMSGHEKHYIPHEDLVNLESAIDDLLIGIENLEDSILTFSTSLIDNTSLDYVQGNHTTEDTTEEVTIYNAVIDATHNVFIRYILAFVYSSGADMLLNYNSDIILFAGSEGNPDFLHEFIFGDEGRSMPFGATLWRYVKRWPVTDVMIPAGSKLQITLNINSLLVGSVIYITTVYARGV